MPYAPAYQTHIPKQTFNLSSSIFCSVVVCFFREGEPLPYGIQVKCDFCRAVPWYRRFFVFLIVRREQAPALRSLEGELHDGRLDSVVVCFFREGEPLPPVKRIYQNKHSTCHPEPWKNIGETVHKQVEGSFREAEFLLLWWGMDDPHQRVFRLRRGSFGCFFTHTNTVLLLRMTPWRGSLPPLRIQTRRYVVSDGFLP